MPELMTAFRIEKRTMKFPLENAIKNKDWYTIEVKYLSGVDVYEDVRYKIRVLSFEKINNDTFTENRNIINLLRTGDLYFLIGEIENATKKRLESDPIKDSLILKDSVNNEFEPFDPYFDSGSYLIIDNYLEERSSSELLSPTASFLPNIAVRGTILFLLPKHYVGNYFLSVIKENGLLIKDGKIYKERDKDNAISGQGWIYVLVNPSMPQNLVKIGMTTRDPDIRVKELSSKTAVPTAFQIIYKKEVEDCKRVETLIHNKLAKYKYQQNKEFFTVLPDKLIPFLDKLCSHFPKQTIPPPLETKVKLRIEEITTEIKRLQEELTSLTGCE